MTQTMGGKSEVVMSCQTQVTSYYQWRYKVQQAVDSPDHQQGVINSLQAEEAQAG
jgi:hypothetical protein